MTITFTQCPLCLISSYSQSFSVGSHLCRLAFNDKTIQKMEKGIFLSEIVLHSFFVLSPPICPSVYSYERPPSARIWGNPATSIAVGQWLVSGLQWSSSAQQSLAARQKRCLNTIDWYINNQTAYRSIAVGQWLVSGLQRSFSARQSLALPQKELSE